MDLSGLEYFLEVCACGSITKAGKSMNVTPQAVSKAIAAFEKKLGYPLLIRTIDGCVPTEKGQEVQRIGIRMMRFQQQGMAEIINMSKDSQEAQEVHIGVWGAFAAIMPASDFADFNTLYPNIKLCIHSYPNVVESERALIAGEVELAFCTGERGQGDYVCVQEYGSTPYLIVNGANKLAEKGRVALADLHGEKLIADYLRDGSGIYFEKEIENAGLTPALILPELSDPLKRSLVLQEEYVAFSYCPTGWLPYGIVPVIVTDIRRFESMWFSRATGRPLSDAAQKYVEYIVPRFKKDIFQAK